jgi:nitrate reductase beta subunit
MGSTFMSAEPPEPKSLISLLMRRSLSIAIYRESFVISVSSAILAIRFIHNADCGYACAAACPCEAARRARSHRFKQHPSFNLNQHIITHHRANV